MVHFLTRLLQAIYENRGRSTLQQQIIERGQVCGIENAILVKNRDYLLLSHDIFAELSDIPNPIISLNQTAKMPSLPSL